MINRSTMSSSGHNLLTPLLRQVRINISRDPVDYFSQDVSHTSLDLASTPRHYRPHATWSALKIDSEGNATPITVHVDPHSSVTIYTRVLRSLTSTTSQNCTTFQTATCDPSTPRCVGVEDALTA